MQAVAAIVSQMMGRKPAASARTRAKRRELTAAWRWYEPQPVRVPAAGARPGSTYRAARRNRMFGRIS